MIKDVALRHAQIQSRNVWRSDSTIFEARPQQEVLTHIVLTSTYLPYRIGGIEKIQHELALGLSELAGQRVVAVSLKYGEENSTIEYDNYDGISLIRIPSPTYSPRALADLVPSVVQVLHAISDKTPSPIILHVHDWFLSEAARVFKEQSSCTIFGYFHLCKKSEHPSLQGEFRQQIHAQQRLLARTSDRVLCYSKFMADCISSSLGVVKEQITVFPCGVDRQSAITYPKKRGPNFSILYNGRLAEEKCVGILLKAFAQLRARNAAVKLIIRGTGSQETSLRSFVSENAVQDVEFRPWTNDQTEIEAQYAEADCVVLPSRFEPFGMVLLEAIERGIPVITTNVGGPSEIVQTENEGWRVTPGSTEALLRALEECLINPQEAWRRAHKARVQVRKRYNWKRAHQVIARHISELLSSQSRQSVGGVL